MCIIEFNRCSWLPPDNPKNISYVVLDSVLLLMLLLRLIWSLLLKCLSSLSWFLPRQGRSYFVTKVTSSDALLVRVCLCFNSWLCRIVVQMSILKSCFAVSPAIRTADELSKIMAFFYYGAAKPPWLKIVGDSQEAIPSVPINAQPWQTPSYSFYILIIRDEFLIIIFPEILVLYGSFFIMISLFYVPIIFCLLAYQEFRTLEC